LSGDFGAVEELQGVWVEEFVRERCPEVVVAAHGPVTAAGVERLGVKVDVVGSRFDSFEGVMDALGLK
jgi:uroporphyrinogen-III synthase